MCKDVDECGKLMGCTRASLSSAAGVVVVVVVGAALVVGGF
jgi:hypothetical protein